MAATVRPHLGGAPAFRALDAALALAGALALLQLVPWPPAVLDRLSPHRLPFDAAFHLDLALTGARPAGSARPFALAPAATAYACALGTTLLLLFWTCRTALARGGVRRLARGLSWLGLTASVLALVQRAVSPGQIYGFWTPLEPGAQPFGPMANRNHFATWLLLALPVAVGYLAAHLESHARGWRGPGGAVRWLRRFDARSIWLLAAGVLMLVTLIQSRSRAAVVSLGVAATFAWGIGRTRREPGARWAVALFVAGGLAALAAWANLGMLLQRFDELVIGGGSGRMLIWRDTLRIVRDFWVTGVGLGGFETAMTVYQRSSRDVFFNHAHNQYLQLAAEGGLLVGLPVLAAGLAFARAAHDALARDRSPIWHLRAGALTGLVAVAVQSLWECGLLTPANAVLLAVSAAIVIHPAAHRHTPMRGS